MLRSFNDISCIDQRLFLEGRKESITQSHLAIVRYRKGEPFLLRQMEFAVQALLCKTTTVELNHDDNDFLNGDAIPVVIDGLNSLFRFAFDASNNRLASVLPSQFDYTELSDVAYTWTSSRLRQPSYRH